MRRGAVVRARPCRMRAGTVEAVRIATWNVNSVKQRLPRLLPWLDERAAGRRLPAGDQARRRRVRRAARRRARRSAATRSPRTASRRWNGVAILSRVGLEDVVARARGRPRLPAPRGARGGGDLRRRPRRLGLRAERPRAGLGPLRTTSSAWLAALRELVAGGRRRRPSCCGDMNIAPADEDVFDPDAYVGQTHVTAARARGAAAAAGARPARRRARPLAGRARVHLLGLPRRHVPPGPRHADRPRARRATRSPSA